MTQPKFKLESSAFSNENSIPTKYTCEGEDISPPLKWEGAPSNTKSFVLISDDPDAPDPDAPKMTWVHWVLYDIPADVKNLSEGAGWKDSEKTSDGGTQGMTDFKRLGYGGPCPPIGTHRYFFKLYALDKILGFHQGKTKEEILKAIKNYVLAETTLMGTYKKNKN